MSIKSQLSDEIKDQLNEVHKIGVATDESKMAINNVGTLIDKFNDIERLEIEQRKIENENFRILSEVEDRKTKNKIAICTAGAGAGITIIMSLLAYVYEERGTITSKAGKRFIDRGFDYFFKR